MSDWFDAGPVEAIEEPGSHGFSLEGSGSADFFVVRKEGRVFAYRNRCPHTGAPLEWLPHRFLDIDNGFIECAMHGALFRVSDGYCLRGPCVNQSLDPLPVEVVNGRIMVDTSAPGGGINADA